MGNQGESRGVQWVSREVKGRLMQGKSSGQTSTKCRNREPCSQAHTVKVVNVRLLALYHGVYLNTFLYVQLHAGTKSS